MKVFIRLSMHVYVYGCEYVDVCVSKGKTCGNDDSFRDDWESWILVITISTHTFTSTSVSLIYGYVEISFATFL